MALSCEELRHLLDEAAPLGTGAAREHLAGCEACRAVVSRSERVAAKLGEWADEPPPAFLHERLMAHVRAAGRERAPQPLWLRRFWWAPTLATALLVAALGVWRAPLSAPAPATSTRPGAPPATVQGATVPEVRGTGSAAPTTMAAPAGAAGPRERPAAARSIETDGGPLRGRPAPAAAESTVACELLGPDGTGRRPLRLAASWAPPPGGWVIIVAPSGEVRLAPEPGAEASPAPLPTLEALAGLGLAPGRYVLQRREHGHPSPVSSR